MEAGTRMWQKRSWLPPVVSHASTQLQSVEDVKVASSALGALPWAVLVQGTAGGAAEGTAERMAKGLRKGGEMQP